MTDDNEGRFVGARSNESQWGHRESPQAAPLQPAGLHREARDYSATAQERALYKTLQKRLSFLNSALLLGNNETQQQWEKQRSTGFLSDARSPSFPGEISLPSFTEERFLSFQSTSRFVDPRWQGLTATGVG